VFSYYCNLNKCKLNNEILQILTVKNYRLVVVWFTFDFSVYFKKGGRLRRFTRDTYYFRQRAVDCIKLMLIL